MTANGHYRAETFRVLANHYIGKPLLSLCLKGHSDYSKSAASSDQQLAQCVAIKIEKFPINRNVLLVMLLYHYMASRVALVMAPLLPGLRMGEEKRLKTGGGQGGADFFCPEPPEVLVAGRSRIGVV